MENATKALLIAGSILVAIILIAFGVRLLGTAIGSINQATRFSSDMEMSIFNSQFESFEGDNVGVTQTKKMARKVKTYNLKAPKTEQIEIRIASGETSSTITSDTEIESWINTLNSNPGYLFKIRAQYDDNGIVNAMRVESQSGI